MNERLRALVQCGDAVRFDAIVCIVPDVLNSRQIKEWSD